MAEREANERAILERAAAVVDRLVNATASPGEDVPAVDTLDDRAVVAWGFAVLAADVAAMLRAADESRVRPTKSVCAWCIDATPVEQRGDLPARPWAEARAHVLEGQEHHWIENTEFFDDRDPEYSCKHCPALCCATPDVDGFSQPDGKVLVLVKAALLPEQVAALRELREELHANGMDWEGGTADLVDILDRVLARPAHEEDSSAAAECEEGYH